MWCHSLQRGEDAQFYENVPLVTKSDWYNEYRKGFEVGDNEVKTQTETDIGGVPFALRLDYTWKYGLPRDILAIYYVLHNYETQELTANALLPRTKVALPPLPSPLPLPALDTGKTPEPLKPGHLIPFISPLTVTVPLRENVVVPKQMSDVCVDLTGDTEDDDDDGSVWYQSETGNDRAQTPVLPCTTLLGHPYGEDEDEDMEDSDPDQDMDDLSFVDKDDLLPAEGDEFVPEGEGENDKDHPIDLTDT